MFVDSHGHLDGPEFDGDRDEMLQRARAAGVNAILNVGTGNPHSGAFERAAKFGEQHNDIYTAIGVHPHDARFYDDSVDHLIRKLLFAAPGMIAWGEIGLDFHYDNSPREVQISVFRRQLRSARELGLPVIIHTRVAEKETVEILRDEWQDSKLPGIMHCFSGSASLATQCVELGFSISFSGIVTFKKADELRAIALEVPLDRLLIETDCPYLTPVPYRGKRNEPAYVVEVAACLAGLRGMTVDEIGRITTDNFSRIFQLEIGN
jgi:TatD DNase family protein